MTAPSRLEEETMRTFRLAAAVLAATLPVALGAAAQSTVYKWTDADGKVHFSDSPPPPASKNVTQSRVGSGPAAASQLPYATQQAMKNNPVTLFTAPQCGDPCTQGRALLSDRGIPYTERDAQASRADADQVKKLVGALQVPVLLVGADPLKGYDPNSWNSALDSAGYPRTKLPGTLAPRPVVVAPPAPAPEAAESAESSEPPK